MEMRVFGRTGMHLSVLGFGCGAVGGLMVRGDPLDQERTMARAIAAGVNYFDTAVQYGNGESEKNLGRVLQRLKPANVAVGTKVRLPSGDFDDIANAVAKSLEGSLARLRLDRIDIFHLHNAITETGGGEVLSIRQVLDDVVPAFKRLRQQGKTRFLGFTAIGDTAALHHYLTWGVVPAPHAAIERVQKLPPAHHLVFENGAVTERFPGEWVAPEIKVRAEAVAA